MLLLEANTYPTSRKPYKTRKEGKYYQLSKGFMGKLQYIIDTIEDELL